MSLSAMKHHPPWLSATVATKLTDIYVKILQCQNITMSRYCNVKILHACRDIFTYAYGIMEKFRDGAHTSSKLDVVCT
jgi:hypothetical protein